MTDIRLRLKACGSQLIPELVDPGNDEARKISKNGSLSWRHIGGGSDKGVRIISTVPLDSNSGVHDGTHYFYPSDTTFDNPLTLAMDAPPDGSVIKYDVALKGGTEPLDPVIIIDDEIATKGPSWVHVAVGTAAGLLAGMAISAYLF